MAEIFKGDYTTATEGFLSNPGVSFIFMPHNTRDSITEILKTTENFRMPVFNQHLPLPEYCNIKSTFTYVTHIYFSKAFAFILITHRRYFHNNFTFSKGGWGTTHQNKLRKTWRLPDLSKTQQMKPLKHLNNILYGGQFTFINSVDKTQFLCTTPPQRSTTVSLETTPFIHLNISLQSTSSLSRRKSETVCLLT